MCGGGPQPVWVGEFAAITVALVRRRSSAELGSVRDATVGRCGVGGEGEVNGGGSVCVMFGLVGDGGSAGGGGGRRGGGQGRGEVVRGKEAFE